MLNPIDIFFWISLFVFHIREKFIQIWSIFRWVNYDGIKKSIIFPALDYFLQFKTYSKELTQRQPIHLRCTNQISLLYNCLCCTVMRLHGDICWGVLLFTKKEKKKKGCCRHGCVNQTSQICQHFQFFSQR